MKALNKLIAVFALVTFALGVSSVVAAEPAKPAVKKEAKKSDKKPAKKAAKKKVAAPAKK